MIVQGLSAGEGAFVFADHDGVEAASGSAASCSNLAAAGRWCQGKLRLKPVSKYSATMRPWPTIRRGGVVVMPLPGGCRVLVAGSGDTAVEREPQQPRVRGVAASTSSPTCGILVDPGGEQVVGPMVVRVPTRTSPRFEEQIVDVLPTPAGGHDDAPTDSITGWSDQAVLWRTQIADERVCDLAC
jgi:hypothetical protein